MTAGTERLKRVVADLGLDGGAYSRARKRLWLTFARRRSLHGSSSWNLPSRFLAELETFELACPECGPQAWGDPGGVAPS